MAIVGGADRAGAAGSRTSGGRRPGRHAGGGSTRRVDYRHLTNTLQPQPAFSEDQVAAIHATALRVLEELGIRVLDAEARRRLGAAGAAVDEADGMVRIDRGLVEQARRTAPGSFDLEGGTPERRVRIGGRSVVFSAVGGPPNVADLDRGKRPGTLEDARNFLRLAQSFDVLHLATPSVEAQDTPLHLRHLLVGQAQLTLSDKPSGVGARGPSPMRDGYEMIRLARGLSEAEFRARPWSYTVINTNSPRQLDLPMCQGIVAAAEAGQCAVITPFTLAGAMAPITVAGALTLQHAEALAGIVLAQVVRPGAPVVYGSFTSNVDMKSGAPAFGTPEYVKGAFGAGQLARHIGLPWRGSAATASNAPDEQATYETLMSMWGSLLGGVNLMIHAAGWLEGGLTASLEKYLIDIEMLQLLAETLQPLAGDAAALAWDAIAEVQPGGHFFAAQHTMERYQSAFYTPLLSDWRNFGSWREDGALTAVQRANRLWKKTLAAYQPPPLDEGRAEALRDYVERRTREGGALPGT